VSDHSWKKEGKKREKLWRLPIADGTGVEMNKASFAVIADST
jgi:hypothetical protein